MARSGRSSPEGDGFKRFIEDIHNISYGSNSSIEGGEMGSRSTLCCDNDPDLETCDGNWEMNYHEAAIYLEEGRSNEKFESHPRNAAELPPYLLVHNAWYFGLDLATSVVLLCLALVEEPAVPGLKLPIGIHGTIELVALSIIAVELILKLRWIGWAVMFRHKRTMIKGIVLSIMVTEVIIVLVRQTPHFRVTRALRPIFIIDTRFCGGVRRFTRQILQSLAPIIDILCLLLFMMSSYALLGYYLFGSPKNTYFKTFADSFISMFVLLTTANFPDVMMPAYSISKWYSLFFISYISIVLYILMNLMLAVVYETFTTIERQKFRKLLLHKRHASQLAFRLLVSKKNPTTIHFQQFQGLMCYFLPSKSARDVVLMYWLLNSAHDGKLTLNDFYNIYDVIAMKWKLKSHSDISPTYWRVIRYFSRAAHILVTWKYFEHIMYALIISNGITLFARAFVTEKTLEESAKCIAASWDTAVFLSLFSIEAILKIVGLGWKQYISSGWHIYDLTVTIAAIIGAIVMLIEPTITFVVIFRPLRLVRLFKLKKRYRDMFGTVVLLVPLILSATLVMLIMYYFFAIIGMELFSKFELRNCCLNTTVEEFYKFSENGTAVLGYYYLNSFSNLLNSGITLFELTVVNNWFITMEAFAIVSNQYSRIFFMCFYIFTMVVITIVVASVLEGFRFRIQYKSQTSKKDEEKMLTAEVYVEWDILQEVLQHPTFIDSVKKDFTPGSLTCYIGIRPRTRDVLQCHMHAQEIKQWMEEDDNAEHISELV